MSPRSIDACLGRAISADGLDLDQQEKPFARAVCNDVDLDPGDSSVPRDDAEARVGQESDREILAVPSETMRIGGRPGRRLTPGSESQEADEPTPTTPHS